MSTTTLDTPKSQTQPQGGVTSKDFESRVHPDWCPGCGDFGVLKCLQQALGELKREPHQTAVVSGIGCSSNLPGFINTYGMHTLHGRSLPVATGLKLSNHELTVVATGGDGDGFGIGCNHFVHTARRNIDITYIVMDNQIYGLTTGQLSPTSMKGKVTKTSPQGSIENPIFPIPLAIASGATYVARGFTGKPKHLIELIKGAILHKGLALVDVFSPCVTFNKENDYKFFNPRIKILEEMNHDTSNFQSAMDRGYQWGDEIYIGLFWKRNDMKTLDEQEPVLHDGNGPLATRPLGLPKDQIAALSKEIM